MINAKNLWTNFCPQFLNSLFSHLNINDHKVFWIRDPDLKQQLFLSPSYETVWNRTCESLYTNPLTFYKALIGRDSNEFVQSLTRNRAVTEDNLCKKIAFYKVFRPDGEIVCIKDIYYNLFNDVGDHIAIAGVAEAISQIQWRLEVKSGVDFNIKSQVENDLLTILEENCRLISRKPACSILKDSDNENFITIKNGKKISLTSRQTQCLRYLFLGKSAKTIARELKISNRTVEFHVQALKEKTNSRSVLELITSINACSI